jgi:hypothetical protein
MRLRCGGAYSINLALRLFPERRVSSLCAFKLPLDEHARYLSNLDLDSSVIDLCRILPVFSGIQSSQIILVVYRT